MKKKHNSLKIPKSETHQAVCLSLEATMLAILSTIIPMYKRSELVNSLLKEYIKKHSQDKVI